jgi:hypothetical protein
MDAGCTQSLHAGAYSSASGLPEAYGKGERWMHTIAAGASLDIVCKASLARLVCPMRHLEQIILM